MNNNVNSSNLLVLCSRFIVKRRGAFICLFMNNVKSILPSFYKSFISTNKLSVNSLMKLQDYIDYIVNDLYISKATLSSEHVILGESYQFRLIKFGIIQFKNFLNYNFNNFSYNMFLNKISVNPLKQRLSIAKKPFSNFIGFKIHCVGRFSRRQRASSY